MILEANVFELRYVIALELSLIYWDTQELHFQIVK